MNKDNLEHLRDAMREKKLEAYLIPTADPHISEYLPEHWRIIPWLTGFTGSSATVVITDSFAGLWTDFRYFIQAEDQLQGSGFILMKPVMPDKKSYSEWIAGSIDAGSF